MQQPAYCMRMRTAMVGLGQQWIAAPAWMAASEEVAKGSRVMSARSSSTFLRTQLYPAVAVLRLHTLHQQVTRSKTSHDTLSAALNSATVCHHMKVL